MSDPSVKKVAEDIGQLADKLDGIIAMLALPLRPDLHIKSLRELLPVYRDTLRQAHIELTGENPWQE